MKTSLYVSVHRKTISLKFRILNPKYSRVICLWSFPTDTSSSIRHRFDFKIPRGMFVEISSILRHDSTWKLQHRFDLEISMWIWLSKLTKYRRVLHVQFSVLFRCRIKLNALLAVSFLSFSNFFFSGNLF